MAHYVIETQAFLVKSKLLSGTSYRELYRNARNYFKEIEKHTKRKPYVRSVYFKKDKVFFAYFWQHLHQKLPSERKQRLKIFACGVELVKLTTYSPLITLNPDNENEVLYRFYGRTQNQKLFCAQVKENKSGVKQLMSVFPLDKKRTSAYVEG